MALVIDRRLGESVLIYPPGSDVPVVVTVYRMGYDRAKIAIDAPDDVFVVRAGLAPEKVAAMRGWRAAKLAAVEG